MPATLLETLCDHFPLELFVRIEAMQALYARLPEKSPGLFGAVSGKGAYPAPLAALIDRARPDFVPSAFSMSPPSLDLIYGLLQRSGTSRILELGAGVSTLTLPTLLPAGAIYLSVDEDTGYLEPFRRLAPTIHPAIRLEFRALEKVQRPDSDAVKVERKRIVPDALAGLGPLVAEIFGAEGPQLVLVDGPSRRVRWGRYSAIVDLLDHLRPGTVVLLDDALRYREVNILAAVGALPRVNVMGVFCVGTGIGLIEIQ